MKRALLTIWLALVCVSFLAYFVIMIYTFYSGGFDTLSPRQTVNQCFLFTMIFVAFNNFVNGYFPGMKEAERLWKESK